MTKIRLLFWTFGLLIICSCLSAQQPKRVYITLDVSSSMRGNKYVMANYTAQLISVFCDTQDLVSIYYLGTRYDLTGKNDYKKLHSSFDQLPAPKATYHEISDLQQFMHDYKPNGAYQDWLFIIGDGDWDWTGAKSRYDQVTKKFGQFVKNNPVQVCYLQTGDKINDDFAFTSFLQSLALPGVEIRKSDTSAKSVQENAVYFANKILGFSGKGIQVKKKDKTSIEFSSVFPLDGFLLLYQDHQGHKREIEVSSAKYADKTIPLRLKGNPTTKPLVEPGQPIMSGEIWECQHHISANGTVSLTFNQAVEIENLRLYPSVDVKPTVQPMSMRGDALEESVKNTFELCEKENKFKVKVEVTDKKGRKFPPSLMQKMTVQLNDGTQKPAANYVASDTTFVIVVPMVKDTLSYYVAVYCPDHFSRISEVHTVVKTEKCPPDVVPLVTLPTQFFSAVRFKDLLNGQAFGGVVNDTLFQHLSSYGFDIQQFQDKQLKDSTYIQLFGDSLCLIQFVNSGWCECAFPDTMRYTLVLKSTSGILLDDKMYEGVIIPISVPVDKRSWIVRCQRYLISLFCSLLIFIYLLALRKKNRFGKSAKVIPYYYDRLGNLVEQGGSLLRENGFAAGFCRWFLPGDERRVLRISRPEVNFTFIATDSKTKIKFPIDQYNDQTMSISGKAINSKDKFVSLGKNGLIEFQKENSTPDGKIVFTIGDKNDEGGYRFLIGVLMLVSAAAFVASVVALIQGLL